MSDLISRQAAIDALFELYEYQRDIDPTEAADLVRQWIYLAEKKIEKLPSAQTDLDSAYTEGYTQAEAKYRALWDEMQANIKEKAFGKRGGLIHTADIDAMPTIEERKTGKWIWKTLDVYKCSECETETHVDECMEEPIYNFCPYCGARLVQEGEQP